MSSCEGSSCVACFAPTETGGFSRHLVATWLLCGAATDWRFFPLKRISLAFSIVLLWLAAPAAGATIGVGQLTLIEEFGLISLVVQNDSDGAVDLQGNRLAAAFDSVSITFGSETYVYSEFAGGTTDFAPFDVASALTRASIIAGSGALLEPPTFTGSVSIQFRGALLFTAPTGGFDFAFDQTCDPATQDCVASGIRLFTQVDDPPQTAVPEPGTLGMLAIGIAAACLRQCRSTRPDFT